MDKTKRQIMNVRGRFSAVLLDKNGKVKARFEAKNGITNTGKNLLLDVFFGGTAASDPWFFGLIDSIGFSILADNDTIASHAGWAEFTGYSEATRVTWPDDAAADERKTNTTEANFSITLAGTLKGFFLVDQNTKGGVTGTLWSTALNDTGDIVVANGDTLKVTYTIAT